MRTTRRTITGIMMAAMMLAAGGALAGDLTPPGAPDSTMHTLEEIYQELLTAQQQMADLEARLDAAGMDVVPDGMVLIPAGEFVMGATTNVGHESNSEERPQHTVNVSAFYMEATEVTKAKWDEVHTWATSNGYSFFCSQL